MRSRERLLNTGYLAPVLSADETKEHPFLGLRIRLGFSFILFLGFFALNYTGTEIGNISAKEIVGFVSKDLDIKDIDFIENFTYTLSDNF